MQQVEYEIDGYIFKGFQYWRYNTILPHLEGTTYEDCVAKARQFRAEAEAGGTPEPAAVIARRAAAK